MTTRIRISCSSSGLTNVAQISGGWCEGDYIKCENSSDSFSLSSDYEEPLADRLKASQDEDSWSKNGHGSTDSFKLDTTVLQKQLVQVLHLRQNNQSCESLERKMLLNGTSKQAAMSKETFSPAGPEESNSSAGSSTKPNRRKRKKPKTYDLLSEDEIELALSNSSNQPEQNNGDAKKTLSQNAKTNGQMSTTSTQTESGTTNVVTNYRRKRDNNNIASRRSREKRKIKLQFLFEELDELEERHRLLNEQERLLRRIVNNITIADEFIREYCNKSPIS